MTTKWFLCCDDAHSNEVVARALDGLHAVDGFKEHECADGKMRSLYDVPEYSFAARMWRSQAELKAKLKIFRSQNNGKPAEWKFPKKKTLLDKLKEVKRKSDLIKNQPAPA